MLINDTPFVFNPVPLSFKKPIDIPARFTETKKLDFVLNFSEIKMPVVDHSKYVNGKYFERSREEIYMLNQLPQATHCVGNLLKISNDYFLNVSIKYEDRCCTTNTPSLSVPLTIMHSANEQLFGFPEPQGYNPTILGHFKM